MAPAFASLRLAGVTHAYHREQEDRAFQLGPIRGVVLERDADVAPVACTEPGVVGANDVVRDAEDVESTGADEVDELAHGECTVAPRRVGVQLGEKWRTRVPHARILLATGWVVG